MFETAVDNPYHFPPRWLNEGLAVYLTRGVRVVRSRDRGRRGGRDGTLIPLDGLTGQFPTTFERFSLGLRRERLGRRLPGPDARPGCARRPHPLVRRRAHRRRGVQRRARASTCRRSRRPGSRTSGRRHPTATDRSPRRPARSRRPGWSGRAGEPERRRPRTRAVVDARRNPPRRRGPGSQRRRIDPRSRRHRGRGRRHRHRPDRRGPGRAPAPNGFRVAWMIGPWLRRSRAGRSRSAWRCCALGFLIAAQLGAEGPRVRYTTQERTPLVETATGLQGEQDELKARILELREAIQGVEEQGQGSARPRPRAQRRARSGADRGRAHPADGHRARPPARRFAGSRCPPAPARPTTSSDAATSGPSSRSSGWPVPRRSRSTASGSRRPPRSSTSAHSLLVNSAYLAPPYQVSAIGPADLYDRLSRSPGFVDFVRAGPRRSASASPSPSRSRSRCPPFAGTVTLRYSRPLASPTASPAAATSGRAEG